MEWVVLVLGVALVILAGLAGWELREIGRLRERMDVAHCRLDGVDRAVRATEDFMASLADLQVQQRQQIEALQRRPALDPADLAAGLAGLSNRLDDLDDLRATLRRVADQNRKQLNLAATAAR